MVDDTSSNRVPGGTPNRRHVTIAALFAAWAVWNLAMAETVRWSVAVIGFAAFAAAAGPGAASSIGSRVGASFRRIGYVGRAIVIVAFAIVLWAAILVGDVPAALANSFAFGGILGIVAIVAIEALRSRGSLD